MAHLAGLDKLLHRAGDVLHGYVGVDAVLIEQVDHVGAQPLQRGVGDLANALGPTVARLGCIPLLEAELGRDHDLIANRLQGLANDFLVDERAVNLGRVEESDLALVSGADQPDRVIAIGCRPVAETQAHASETDGRDFEAAIAKLAFLHGVLLAEASGAGRRQCVGKKIGLFGLCNKVLRTA